MIRNVTHHTCSAIPERWEIYIVDGDKKYLVNIGNLVGIEVNYCPFCGAHLVVEERSGSACEQSQNVIS